MTLLVFAVVVAYVTLWLRTGLREQILQREAEALTEVASLQLTTETEALAALGVVGAPGQLFTAVLKTSKLRGVFAVRVFDAQQHFSGALPIPWSEAPPSQSDWKKLALGEAVARLHPRESAAEVIGLAPLGGDTQPLLETWLPLRTSEKTALLGVAQMWTDGAAVAREFGALDDRLFTQALLAWAAGAFIIALLLGWAFRQLANANRQLRDRSADLIRANRELTLAAKTSALGAIAAHLMHELKNPVAGLEEFVASQTEAATTTVNGTELAAASELTRRLRAMINDVVAVMRDEQTGVAFELTPAEIVELAVAKATPLAKDRGVTIATEGGEGPAVSGHRANLLGLVLHNLLQNSIEASAGSSVVKVSAGVIDQQLQLRVQDQGPGLPPAVQQRLFQPCTSTKRGGSGLGLALSQHLARQAGARIELLRSDASGTCFQVVLDSTSET